MATVTIDNIAKKDLNFLKQLVKRMGWSIAEEKTFDDETMAAIERARKEFEEGKCKTFSSATEIDEYFKGL